jgi:hypothetical protein
VRSETTNGGCSTDRAIVVVVFDVVVVVVIAPLFFTAVPVGAENSDFIVLASCLADG